jgi:hypothetical protein
MTKLAKSPTPTFGRGIPHPDGVTPEQVAKWHELGGIGHHPATKQAMERAICYLLTEKAREESAGVVAMPHAIPGPEHDPNDRGECLAVLGETPDGVVRCDGRRISSMEYHAGEGYVVRWKCTTCDWSKVV